MSTWYTALRKSFPANEMKSKAHFDRLLTDQAPRYKVEEGPDYVLVSFETEEFVFVDFILVHSANRRKGVGSKGINRLKQKGKPIILEVEPASSEDPDTGKRIRFYEKAGFKGIDSPQYTRIHPVTKDVNEMKLYYWAPALKCEKWAMDVMAIVYREVHAYCSEELYGVPPQDMEEVLVLRETALRAAE